MAHVETTETTPAIASHPHWITPDGRLLTAEQKEVKKGPFNYERMLRRLPANVRASLTAEQLDAISDALIPDPPSHGIDYRVSIPFFGRRFYVTLLAGRERRSLARLAREAQLHAKHVAIFYSVLLLFLACVSFVGAVLLGYIAKSALDIDLTDGPSMLHQFFFPEQSGMQQAPGMMGMAGTFEQPYGLTVRIPKT